MTPIIPFIAELSLAGLILGGLLWIVFTRYEGLLSQMVYALGTILLFLIVILWGFPLITQSWLLLHSNPTLVLAKQVSLFLVLISIGATARSFKKEGITSPEFILLLTASVIGGLLQLSAHHLLMLFVALELLSLPGYIMVATQRDQLASTEAALKYFFLGGVSSAFFLMGSAFVYGATRSLEFSAIANVILSHPTDLLLDVGLTMIILSLGFKLSAAPGHVWAPDVYERAPLPQLAFLSVPIKWMVFLTLAILLWGPFGQMVLFWQISLACLAMLSLLIGSFGGLAQTNLRRLLAYSTIAQIGFVLLGLAIGTQEGLENSLIYLLIYGITSIGLWGLLSGLRHNGEPIHQIADLKGLGRLMPSKALQLALFLFSLAGLPPLAGFWAKAYILNAAIHQSMVWLSIVAVLTSVIAAAYYLKVIATMYFEDTATLFETTRLGVGRLMVLACFLFVSTFTIFPDSLRSITSPLAQGIASGFL